MKNLFRLIILVIYAFGQNQAVAGQLDQSLRIKADWHSKLLGKPLPVRAYYHKTKESQKAATIVVYVKNIAAERIGLEPDEDILCDYVNQGYFVITVDYLNDARAISPWLEQDLYLFHRMIYGFQTKSLFAGKGFRLHYCRCFFLPAGYRFLENVVYWQMDKHGANGTVDYLIDSYNTYVAGKYPDRPKVSRLDEMLTKDGRKVDMALKMDIIYPSQSKTKVPLMFYAQTDPAKPPSLYYKKDKLYYHTIGFVMRGYAYANFDHNYNPLWRSYFGKIKYSMDNQNGLASSTAAVRYIRAHAKKYNINPNYIGGMGHSKGQYTVTRLSDPHNASAREESLFSGGSITSPEPQPWLGYSSRITCGYQSMGWGLYRPEFILPEYAPTFIACGVDEAGHNVRQHKLFVEQLKNYNLNHFSIMMDGLGHSLPAGKDPKTGIDYYDTLCMFFDQYLRPDKDLPPAVLLITPGNNIQDVPIATWIDIYFAPAMDPSTILNGPAVKLEGCGIKLVCLQDNSQVRGFWKQANNKTKFSFKPDQLLKKNTRYRLVISPAVSNHRGRALDREITTEFVTAAN